MAYENKPGFGSLLANTRKSNDSQPDWRGSAKFACPHCKHEAEMEVAAWAGETSRGDARLGLKIQPPRERQDNAPAPSRPARDISKHPRGEYNVNAPKKIEEDFDDPIPF